MSAVCDLWESWADRISSWLGFCVEGTEPCAAPLLAISTTRNEATLTYKDRLYFQLVARLLAGRADGGGNERQTPFHL